MPSPIEILHDDVQSSMVKSGPTVLTDNNSKRMGAPFSWTESLPLDGTDACFAMTRTGNILFVTISTTGSIGAIVSFSGGQVWICIVPFRWTLQSPTQSLTAVSASRLRCYLVTGRCSTISLLSPESLCRGSVVSMVEQYLVSL